LKGTELTETDVDLTVITPCFNEENSILFCIESVKEMMSSSLPNLNYEHIIMDNCSTDSTYSIALQLSATYPNLRVFRNSRNVGALNNIYEGLKKSKGRAVVPMLPADLQDPVDLIPELYAKFLLGFLVVFGERKRREENFVLSLVRKGYYRILRTLASSKLPVDAGEFLIADRRVILSVLADNPQDPYLRGLIAQSTDLVTSVPYTWTRRLNDKSKTNLTAMIDVGLSGLVATSRVPGRIAIFIGLTSAVIGIFGSVWVVSSKIFLQSSAPDGVTSILVIMLLIGGVQLFFLGIIGEYVLSIHGQVKPKPKVFEIGTETPS
jgi:glycosyltransferase involved in cell wall biosynthesis